jgi:hypothetical protein
MPKRKRQPDNFDVAEFLRESDDDLKSALHSLLHAPESASAVNLNPNSDLTPPIKLEDPGPVSPRSLATITLDAGPELGPDISSDPNANGPDIKPDSPLKLNSGTKLRSGTEINTPSISASPINLVHKRHFAIREMRHPADAHTRAEQHVYECLWEIAKPYDEISRSVMIGFGAMANLVGLSESNARINLRSLLAKLAVEEIGQYYCERSQGRTYRIFNETEILRRRREVGLRWYMRRTLAVVFVDPATGQPLLKSKPLRRQDPVLS